MEKETKLKDRLDLKSDMATGVSSAIGATIGMAAANALAPEAHAAETPGEKTAHTGTGQSSPSAHSGAATGPAQPLFGSDPAQNQVPASESGSEPVQDPLTPEAPEKPEESDGPGGTGESGDPEIVVLDYGTITVDDGSQVDAALVSIDGQEALIVDVDQDGIADVMMADLNGDDKIDDSEVMDIHDDGISMASFQTEVTDVPDTLIAQNDYVNDANVDEYMA